MMIRPLRDTDVASVIELGIRAWTPVFPHIESTYGSELYGLLVTDPVQNQRTAIEGVCRDKSMAVYVAEDEKGVVGFAAMKASAGDEMAEIYMIAVDPGSQRHGIATQLMETCEKHARDNRIAVVMVETGSDEGHEPARHLYRSSGYHLVEVARYFKVMK